MSKKLGRLTKFLQSSASNLKKVVENPLEFFNTQQDLSKYILKYASVYEVKEVSELFRKHLEEEFNTSPFDFIMEYLDLEEDYEDKENIKILKHFIEIYFDETSEEEINLSSKIKNEVLEKINSCKQLTEEKKWKIGETLKKLFYSTHKNLKMDLASDSFTRFLNSQIWKNNIKKFIKNTEVMEKVEIYDIKESKEKRWSRKISKEEEEEEKERKEELAKKYLSDGLELFKKQQWEEAYESFTMAITYNENLKEAYFNRGVLSYNSQKYIDAIADMSFVIEKDPTNPRALSVQKKKKKKKFF